MRRLYFIGNLFLLLAIAGLGTAYWRYRPEPPDRCLEWKTPEIAAGYLSPPESPPVQPAVITGKNLFSPNRGAEAAAAEPDAPGRAAPPRFELVGLCSIGEDSGAIIEVKSVASGGKNGNQVRRYFPIGAEVFNGYILDSATGTTAILKRKNEILELKIDRSRHGAASGAVRKDSASPVPPPPPPPAPVVRAH